MKYKSTLLLLLAVAIAGVAAYSLSRKPTSLEASRARKTLLPEFKTADVKRLTIEHAGGRIVCRRESPDEWRILEPLDVRAERWQVEGILDALQTARKVSSTFPDAGEGLDLSAYGLEEPVRTVSAGLDESGPPAWTLRIGDPTGVGEAVFVAVDGREGVFAIEQAVADKTDVTLTALRSKVLASRISTFELGTIALSTRSATVECRKADGRWELAAPMHDLADKAVVEALANKLYDHRLADDDFVLDDPTRAAEYGLDEPALTVTLTGDDKTQTVLFARKGEGEEAECYALTRGEPGIVRVPASLVDELSKQPADLREHTLADFRPEKVGEVDVTGSFGTVLLTKADDEWRITGESPAPADAEAMDELLDALKGLEVQEFVADDPADPAPYGLAEGEAVELRLRDDGGEELAALSFGAADEAGELVYARRAGYPAVLAVPHGAFRAALGRGRLAFLVRNLLDEPRSAARRIVLTRGGESFECAWQRERAAWDLVKPAGGPADRYAVQDILGDLAPLRAAAIAAEQADDLGAYGLDAPAVVLEVNYEPEQAPPAEGAEPAELRVRTIHVGAETDDPVPGFYARLADGARVFVLAEAVVNHLHAELASRDVCRAPDLSGLTFRMANRALSFSYDEAAMNWTDAEGAALPEGILQAVGSAAYRLSDLRSDHVADYVEKTAALYGFDEPYLTVTLDEPTMKGKRVVVGDEAPEGGRYARGPATDYVHVVSEADVAALTAVFAPPEPAP